MLSTDGVELSWENGVLKGGGGLVFLGNIMFFLMLSDHFL